MGIYYFGNTLDTCDVRPDVTNLPDLLDQLITLEIRPHAEEPGVPLGGKINGYFKGVKASIVFPDQGQQWSWISVCSALIGLRDYLAREQLLYKGISVAIENLGGPRFTLVVARVLNEAISFPVETAPGSQDRMIGNAYLADRISRTGAGSVIDQVIDYAQQFPGESVVPPMIEKVFRHDDARLYYIVRPAWPLHVDVSFLDMIAAMNAWKEFVATRRYATWSAYSLTFQRVGFGAIIFTLSQASSITSSTELSLFNATASNMTAVPSDVWTSIFDSNSTPNIQPVAN